MAQTNIFTDNDHELEVAVCTRTYFKLNGYMPSIDELCRQLGKGYRELIGQLLNRPAFVSACCA